MSERTSLQPEDPLPASKERAEQFLRLRDDHRAFNHLIDNEGNPIPSTLAEIIDETGIDAFMFKIRGTPQEGESKLVKNLLGTIREGFQATYAANEFYDPLDGDSNVGEYFELETLTQEQKEVLYQWAERYNKYLKESAGPQAEKKIARHALRTVKVHGRRSTATADNQITPNTDS